MGEPTEKQRPTIVLLGDSITQWGFCPGGWGNLLAHRYMRKADVVNRGFSGYNSAWILQAVKKSAVHASQWSESDCLSDINMLSFADGQPAISEAINIRQVIKTASFVKLVVPDALLVTIFLGANDAVLPDGTSCRQFVPLDDFRSNIAALVAAARAAGAQHVVIISPPPVDEAARVAYNKAMHGSNARDSAERSNATTGQYAAACVEVGRAVGVPVVDLWTRLQERAEWRALLSDGLHLSDAGNEAVFGELQRCLDEELPQMHPDVLPLDMPLHGDLTAENYKHVLEAYL